MIKNLLLSIRIIGFLAFSLFLGGSFVFASPSDGPSNEEAQLKQFYEYLFGTPNVNFSNFPKIPLEVIQGGETNKGIQSNQIENGTIESEDIAEGGVSADNLKGMCNEGSIPVFDGADGNLVCTPRGNIEGNGVTHDSTLSGDGKNTDLSVNFDTVQQRIEESAVCTGENMFVVGVQEKDEGGIEFKCVSVVDGDNNASNEIQSAAAGGGLSTNTNNEFQLITTCESGQVLKWNGSQWACQDDEINEDTRLSDTEVIDIITNAKFIKNASGEEEDPVFTESNLNKKISVSDTGHIGIGGPASDYYSLDLQGTDNTMIRAYSNGGIPRLSLENDTAHFSQSVQGDKFLIYDENNQKLRMIINNDGNVGIGTTTPTEKLDVSGNGKFSGKITSASTVDDDSATTVTTKDYVDGKISGVDITETDPVFTESNLNKKISVSDTGHIGIGGPASDYYSLDLQGTDNTMIRAYSNGGIPRLSLENDTAHFSQSVQGDKFLIYDENNQKLRMIINNDGNVGIGTIDPKKKLDVKTNSSGYIAEFGDGTNVANIYSTGRNIGFGSGEGSKVKLYVDNDFTKGMTIDTDGSVETSGKITSGYTTYTADDNNVLTTKDYVDGKISGEIGSIVETDPKIAEKNLDKITVTSDGKVGIGVSSFTRTLEIASDKLTRYNALGIDGHLFLGSDGTNSSVYAQGGGAELELGGQGSIKFTAGGTAGNATEKMKILANGKVGIGTTTPTEKLDVSGNGKFSGKITSASTADADSATTVTTKDYVDGKVGEAGKWSDATGGIQYPGRVNIGTAFNHNTVGKLMVNGDGPDNGLTIWNEAGATTFRMWADASKNMGYITRGDKAEKGIAIDVNGKVGIGTTTPTEKLDVSGNGKFSGKITSASTADADSATTVTTKDYVDGKISGGLGSIEINSLTDAKTDGYSVFLGKNSGTSNTGSSVTASGYASAQNNTGNSVTANGYQSAQHNTGNNITANGIYSAQHNTGNYITASGYQSANSNTGSSLVANGYLSAYNNTGNSVTANGMYSARNNTGGSVTANGYASAQNNTGNYLTANGYASAQHNTGNFVTSNGAHSAQNNTGNYVTANGMYSAINNTGNSVIANGAYSAQNNTGSSVTANGYASAQYNSKNNNTALGDGTYNTWINGPSMSITGADSDAETITIPNHNLGSAGKSLPLRIQGTSTIGGLGTNGTYTFTVVDANTLKGIGVNISSFASGTKIAKNTADYTNITALGYNAEPTKDNQIMLGDTHITEVFSAGKFVSGKSTLDGDTEKTLTTKDYVDGKISGGLGSIEINSLTDAKTGGNSVFLGSGAGASDDGSDNRNTAVGIDALHSNTTGHHNTANGVNSLLSNTTGYYNTANGYQSLNSNTTGSYNTANGYEALYANTTGYANTANGYQSLNSNTTGSHNTANGMYSLNFNTTGNYNTANGDYSLLSNTTGNYNTAQGMNAGRFIADGTTGNTTGNYNTFIGSNTKALADNDQNETVIGYNTTGNGSNTVTLGNDDVTKTVLKGNVGIGTNTPNTYRGNGLVINGGLNSGVLRLESAKGGLTSSEIFVDNKGINFENLNGTRNFLFTTGNVGIGTTTPTEKLDVSGNIAFSGTLKKTGTELRCETGEVLVGFGNNGPICESAQTVSGGVAVWQ